ncbi:MAG: HEPN domain-containing protein [Anaerolineae bacterium]|nr:HEPN domain-containing protein [Anaerolineae bacterium]
MSDDTLEWIERAEEDFRMAQAALRQRKFKAYNSVCFHAQQCAEKYLKAFLVRHHIPFRKTHDLRELRRQCVEVDNVFDMLTDALLLLNQFAIDTRYPGLALTEQDARDAVAAVKQVRAFVRARLGLKTK